ncbi:hypothetical protein [Streptosporangium lutulentum]|uniref:WXG100 family type VII secretion target n=1 Tax=Streptosporangium lutulentum TaxID=1461250 RepID=A0ABT9QRN8_9ACTN|nr:hypothetical protein [Streptosporangium lutulentum]MDP9849398.1 hypothetical protein [Streptosporangium lutulentum]
MADADVGGAYGGFFLDSGWPGLDSAKDELYVDKEKIEVVVKALEENLARLKGAEKGSLSNLTEFTNLTEMQLGTWNTAKALSKTVGNAHTASTGVYQEIIEKYEAAISLIKSAAMTHGMTEVKNIEDMQF